MQGKEKRQRFAYASMNGRLIGVAALVATVVVACDDSRPTSPNDEASAVLAEKVRLSTQISVFTDSGAYLVRTKPMTAQSRVDHGVSSFEKVVGSITPSSPPTFTKFGPVEVSPSNSPLRFTESVDPDEVRSTYSRRAPNGDVVTFAYLSDANSNRPPKRIFIFVNGVIQTVQTMSWKRTETGWAPKHVKALMFKNGSPKLQIETEISGQLPFVATRPADAHNCQKRSPFSLAAILDNVFLPDAAFAQSPSIPRMDLGSAPSDYDCQWLRQREAGVVAGLIGAGFVTPLEFALCLLGSAAAPEITLEVLLAEPLLFAECGGALAGGFVYMEHLIELSQLERLLTFCPPPEVNGTGGGGGRDETLDNVAAARFLEIVNEFIDHYAVRSWCNAAGDYCSYNAS